MRVTSSMYYNSLYGSNNLKLNDELFDVNKQIASGLKIEYAKDNVRAFAETMVLDNELASLELVKKSTQSGYKISNQTDVILNEFGVTMNRMRVLLVNASNGTHSDTSLDAIASELRVMEEHFRTLSNTSINGQYLFSGTAVDIKPIMDDGSYNGNDGSLKSFLGSRNQQQYNLSGAELFFGEEILVKREITTNVIQTNLSKKYDFSSKVDNGTLANPITIEDTIRDLMGDTDGTVDTLNNKHHFYVRGVKSDGIAFNETINMKDDDKVDELLTHIGNLFGNVPNLKIVNVSLNKNGEIVVEDKIKGSSKLDFHMVGAVDFDHSDGNDLADISDGVYGANAGKIDNLDDGEVYFREIMNPITPPAKSLFVKEFVKSGYTPIDGAATNIEGLVYDRTQFLKDGSKLSSTTAQIIRDGNAFASESTKLSEVADISQLPNVGSLDGTQFKLVGTGVTGVNYDVQIDLATTGSTFSLDGGITNYDIFDMGSPRTAIDADEMTYQQLMDVVNMVVTGNLPASNIASDYDKAIKTSNFNGNTFLSYDGKIQFQELGRTDTKASIALYDSSSGNFTKPSSVMMFSSNNTLTIRDPKTDFFKELDEMIRAVEDHKTYPNNKIGSTRNVGIENAITKIDDLQDHLLRSHALVGAQSNALTSSLERTSLLEISTMTLRSEVIDTDLAEASLKLTQLSLNYEAMLSTVGRISKLSLVNYL